MSAYGGKADVRELPVVCPLIAISGHLALPTDIEDRHANCEPRPESPSTAESATVFGRLEVLSGKSRLRAIAKYVAAGGVPLVPLYELGIQAVAGSASGLFLFFDS